MSGTREIELPLEQRCPWCMSFTGRVVNLYCDKCEGKRIEKLPELKLKEENEVDTKKL